VSVVRVDGATARGRAAQLRAIGEDFITTADGADHLARSHDAMRIERDNFAAALQTVCTERDELRELLAHCERENESLSRRLAQAATVQGQDEPVPPVGAVLDQSPGSDTGTADGGVTAAASVVVVDTDGTLLGIMEARFTRLFPTINTDPILPSLPIPDGWRHLADHDVDIESP